MNTKTKIHELWDYLKIQDDEILIVRSYNATKETDEFIVAQMNDNEVEIIISDTMPKLIPGTSFQLIQQLDSDGKHKIPSVEQIKRDELLDY